MSWVSLPQIPREFNFYSCKTFLSHVVLLSVPTWAADQRRISKYHSIKRTDWLGRALTWSKLDNFESVGRRGRSGTHTTHTDGFLLLRSHTTHITRPAVAGKTRHEAMW